MSRQTDALVEWTPESIRRWHQRFRHDTGSPDVAADLVQELYLKLRKYDSGPRGVMVQSAAALTALAYRHVLFDWIRRKRRSLVELTPDGELGHDVGAGPAARPDVLYERRSLTRHVYQIIARMPLSPLLRALTQHEDWAIAKPQDLAQRLGTTAKTIRTHRSRLLTTLRTHLRRAWA